jgi:hypothetical protein
MHGRKRAMPIRICMLAAMMACAACTQSSSGGPAGTSGGDAAAADAGKIATSDGGDARAPFPVVDAGALDDTTIPPTSSEELNVRAKHLLEAIAAGNAELASDMLFPRDGYVASRDSSEASKMWDKKISAPFKRHVASLHKRKGMDRAQFVSIDLGHSVSQIATKKRDWKKPLWRVKGSTLSYIVDGKTSKVSIAEMIAWRGAWYVTRLK